MLAAHTYTTILEVRNPSAIIELSIAQGLVTDLQVHLKKKPQPNSHWVRNVCVFSQNTVLHTSCRNASCSQSTGTKPGHEGQTLIPNSRSATQSDCPIHDTYWSCDAIKYWRRRRRKESICSLLEIHRLKIPDSWLAAISPLLPPSDPPLTPSSPVPFPLLPTPLHPSLTPPPPHSPPASLSSVS